MAACPGLILSSIQTNTDTFTNSVDPDEMAICHSVFDFLTETPICSNGCVQIKRWKSPFQKLRGEICILSLQDQSREYSLKVKPILHSQTNQSLR